MTDQENPLLRKIAIPGETFKLPSGGLMYEEGILAPDVKNGEILINPMVAIDEIILKTPDKLFSGDAITEVFKHCVPQVLQPLKMFSKDIDFIMVCLRKVSYGDKLEISTKHDCKDAQTQTYTLSLSEGIQQSKPIDPTTITQQFQVTLDNGQTVRLNPPIFGNVIKMFHSFGKASDSVKEDEEKLKNELLTTVAGMIHQVDDVTNQEQIREWIANIPVMWMYKISERIEEISDWGPETEMTLNCKDCKKDFIVTTPLNPLSLFT